jgi:CRISPR-associated protein Cmr5
MSQTLDQRRAADAWALVEKLKDDKHGLDLARQAKKLPVRIVTSGLGPALAFLNAKEGRANGLCAGLGAWVLDRRGIVPTGGSAQKFGGDLLSAVVHGDSDFLRRATAETLAWLQWLNRFAEAEPKLDSKGSD